MAEKVAEILEPTKQPEEAKQAQPAEAEKAALAEMKEATSAKEGDTSPEKAKVAPSEKASLWPFKTSSKHKNAEDCLPSDELQALRAMVIDKSLSDDAADIVSAALGVGERIRARNLYIENAAQRLQFVVSCVLQSPPKLILARDALLRMQLEISEQTGFIGGRIARLSGGSSTVTVLAALVASLFLWGAIVVGVRVLLDGRVLQFFAFQLSISDRLTSLFKNVFFMDQRALLVVVSAAFLGGVVSIATRLAEFAKVRGLDPFAMFWTALLKPLIGVTLSVFILAALSGGIIGLGILDKDPLGLVNTNNQPIGIGDTGTFTAKTAYVLWVIGFLAGFSERFATDFVQRTEGLASGNVGGDKKGSSG